MQTNETRPLEVTTKALRAILKARFATGTMVKAEATVTCGGQVFPVSLVELAKLEVKS